MVRDMRTWLQQTLEEEQHIGNSSSDNNGGGFRIDDDDYLMSEIQWYMDTIPPHSEQVVPNFEIQNQQQQQQQNMVCPSDPTATILTQPLGSSSFLPPDNFGFCDLLNTSTNDNVNTTTTKNNDRDNNINNSPFGSVFNQESQSGCLTPFPFPGNQMDLSTQTGQLPVFSETSAIGFALPIGLQEGSSFGGSGSLNSLFNEKMGIGGNEGEDDGGLKEAVDIGKMENNGDDGGNGSEDEDGVREVDRKGKNKENLSKSRLAEKMRRKKLNDNLHSLRVIVPIINKMDKASILGDAVEYLNELNKKINDLQSELESNSPGSSLTPTTSTLPVQQCGQAPRLDPGQIKVAVLNAVNDHLTRCE